MTAARLFTLTLALLLAAVVIRGATVETPVLLDAPLQDLPDVLGGWEAAGGYALDAESIEILGADDYLSRTYARDGVTADLFIGYYASQRRGETIHSPMNCLPGAGWQPLSAGRLRVEVGRAAPIEINRYVIQKGLDKRLALYWYQSRNRTVASEYAAKAYLVLDSLRERRSDAALVRVVTPLRGDEGAVERAAAGFVRTLYPVLTAHLPR